MHARVLFCFLDAHAQIPAPPPSSERCSRIAPDPDDKNSWMPGRTGLTSQKLDLLCRDIVVQARIGVLLLQL